MSLLAVAASRHDFASKPSSDPGTPVAVMPYSGDVRAASTANTQYSVSVLALVTSLVSRIAASFASRKCSAATVLKIEPVFVVEILLRLLL